MIPARRTPPPCSSEMLRAVARPLPQTITRYCPAYPQPGPIWALSTGQAPGTNKYSWTQVNDGDPSGGFGTSLDPSMTAQGSTTNAPAYEINGNTSRSRPTVRSGCGSTRPGDLSLYVFEYESARAAAPFRAHPARQCRCSTPPAPTFRVGRNTSPRLTRRIGLHRHGVHRARDRARVNRRAR